MVRLPSERAKEEQQQEQESEKLLEQSREILNRLFKTEDGRFLFDWIKKECGFESNAIVYDNNFNISLEKTVYNEGRRNLYLQLRSFIHKDLLKDLEQKENEY